MHEAVWSQGGLTVKEEEENNRDEEEETEEGVGWDYRLSVFATRRRCPKHGGPKDGQHLFISCTRKQQQQHSILWRKRASGVGDVCGLKKAISCRPVKRNELEDVQRYGEDLLGLLPAQPTLLPLTGCADTVFKR